VAREAVKDRGWADAGVTRWDPSQVKAEDV